MRIKQPINTLRSVIAAIVVFLSAFVLEGSSICVVVADSWMKNDGTVTIDVNVLADTASRKWVPNLSGFFRNRIDFENFTVRYRYC